MILTVVRFVAEPNVLTSTADGKIIVYPSLEKGSLISVKRGLISPEYLLSDDAAAKIYFGGSALVLRQVCVRRRR